MEEILIDYTNWLDDNDRLKVNRHLPPFESSDTIVNYYIKTILPELKIQRKIAG